MKALVFYTPSDVGIAEIELEQLEQKLDEDRLPVEKVDLESRRGSELAQSFDIMVAPALVLLREDGAAQALWQSDLPTSDQLHAAIGYV
jgi:hypothetical protein